jgi:hypothetical protein
MAAPGMKSSAYRVIGKTPADLPIELPTKFDLASAHPWTSAQKIVEQCA